MFDTDDFDTVPSIYFVGDNGVNQLKIGQKFEKMKKKSDVKSSSKTFIDKKDLSLSIGKVWLEKCQQEGGTQSSGIIFSSLTLLFSKSVDIFSTSIIFFYHTG